MLRGDGGELRKTYPHTLSCGGGGTRAHTLNLDLLHSHELCESSPPEA